MTTIRVDIRERELYARLKELVGGTEEEAGIQITHEPLDIGDVHVQDATSGGLFVFERKTMADLAASIKDGRYREQKARMRAGVRAAHHVTYLVEGGGAVQPSNFWGMYINTMYRDGMHVVCVRDTSHSAQWVYELATRLRKSPATFMGVGGGGDAVVGGSYLDQVKVKTKKCENIDPATCYKLQLCQIPGVSVRLAEGIAERFPSMFALLKAIEGEETNEARVRLLSTVPLVGAKKAAVILEYLRPSGDA